MRDKAAARAKAERALELADQGIAAVVIAERLGMNRQRVHEAVSRLRKELREKAGEVVE